ncbi:MAG TPA: DUF2726 domain-containing protein [Nitrospiraceae bacterium]|nr:DUF2726 domain-containing protein [Nitrospiraceae bacterium]
MDPAYWIGSGGAALVTGVAGWMLASRCAHAQRSTAAPALDTPVTLQPLLTEAQARFYNLLRLAVEDRYLVLAHVPLWCVVNVPMRQSGTRLPFLSRLALKRATFVLVHPGTRLAEKVVEWKDEKEMEPSGGGADRLLESVLKPAGVQVITIHAGDSHTVADIIALFKLGESDQ